MDAAKPLIHYEVRYVSVYGPPHVTTYWTIDAALADARYPMNERKQLFEVRTIRTDKRIMEPNWKGAK